MLSNDFVLRAKGFVSFLSLGMLCYGYSKDLVGEADAAEDSADDPTADS